MNSYFGYTGTLSNTGGSCENRGKAWLYDTRNTSSIEEDQDTATHSARERGSTRSFQGEIIALRETWINCLN